MSNVEANDNFFEELERIDPPEEDDFYEEEYDDNEEPENDYDEDELYSSIRNSSQGVRVYKDANDFLTQLSVAVKNFYQKDTPIKHNPMNDTYTFPLSVIDIEVPVHSRDVSYTNVKIGGMLAELTLNHSNSPDIIYSCEIYQPRSGYLTHPHIVGEHMCALKYLIKARALLNVGRIEEAILQLEASRIVINEDDLGNTIISEYTCHCGNLTVDVNENGEIIKERHRNGCFNCNGPICEQCSIECEQCGHIICKRCSRTCVESGATLCRYHTCSYCGSAISDEYAWVPPPYILNVPMLGRNEHYYQEVISRYRAYRVHINSKLCPQCAREIKKHNHHVVLIPYQDATTGNMNITKTLDTGGGSD